MKKTLAFLFFYFSAKHPTTTITMHGFTLNSTDF